MDLKQRIKKKYGSVNRFARLVKKEYHTIRAAIESDDKEKKKWLKDLISKTPNKTLDNYEMPKGLPEKIRISIRAKYDTYLNFHAEHEEFLPYWISGLVNGKMQRLTPKVVKLCKILKIKIK